MQSTIYPATSCDFDCESYTKYGSGTFPLTTVCRARARCRAFRVLPTFGLTP